jgi:DNA-binding response OmpR family regulator
VTNSNMPHLDGPHLAECLRELSPALPIIHLSGSHGTQHLREMPAHVPTIFKPFDIWELVSFREALLLARWTGVRTRDQISPLKGSPVCSST